MGDFYYGDFNWETMDQRGGEFIGLVQDCFSTQHVNSPT